MIYIYKLQNLINNKIYIGQTNNMKYRYAQHKCKAKKNKCNSPLYNAIRKYGLDNFSYTEVTRCETLDLANECEIYLIAFYNTTKIGYNLSAGGAGLSGYIFTQEHKDNISKGNTGKKYGRHSEERIRNMMKGKEKVDKIKWKQKISDAHTGKIIAENHKDNISKSIVKLKKIRGNSSIYKGVNYHKNDKRFVAVLKKTSPKITFRYASKNEIEAAMAYDYASKLLHGEDSYQNLPDNLTDEQKDIIRNKIKYF